MMTDPISDMLTRIRNALAVKKQKLVLPYSKIKHEIAKTLKKEGYISEVEKIKDKFDVLEIVLTYKEDGLPAIAHIQRTSKPGRRVYVSRDKIPFILNDLGIAILSTSQGIMTNKQARRAKVGGEIICEVW